VRALSVRLRRAPGGSQLIRGVRRTSGNERPLSPTDPPLLVRIASDCSGALDRGEKNLARILAEQGLELAIETSDPKWIRRFQHLHRVAKGAAIATAPRETPSQCSFCLKPGGNLIAGQETFICELCIRKYLGQLSGPISVGTSGDVRCSFCRASSYPPLFEGHGYFICAACIREYAEAAVE